MITRPAVQKILLSTLAMVGWQTLDAAQEVSFDRDVRPVLAAACFACHGPDAETREADLRLDTAAGAAAVIEAGDAKSSTLLIRVDSDDADNVMPPPDSGHELNEPQKEVLRRWIDQGAKYETHWSFVPPSASRDAIPPNVHPVDHFVRTKLAAAGLTPSEPADRYQLIRRLTLDLTGLPPSPEQADAFVEDESAEAVEKVVDRLLASDAFGEHWARMWLDLARYADTKGYEKDNPREIWRYRDWVIDAFNQDMPFDQFTTWQLAGDLLPNATIEQRLATAFHRNTLTNEEGGTDDEEFRVAAVKDRVDTTMQVWMGLTMGCAKCHSHKYDPISQEEYYRFYAIFNQTVDADRESPTMPSPTSEQKNRVEALERELVELSDRLREVSGSESFSEAFQSWQRQRQTNPVWRPLSLVKFRSEHGLELETSSDGRLVTKGATPERDTWNLTLSLPRSPGQKANSETAWPTITAIRLETFPKRSGEGNPSDGNHVINELTLAVLDGEDEPTAIELTNARADFAQNNWPVTAAIDSKAATGWAVSPKAHQPHVAIFDFRSPVRLTDGMQVQLRMAQNYGNRLVLSRFRISVSDSDPDELKPVADDDSREAFQSVFPASRQLIERRQKLEKQLADARSRFARTPVMQELPGEKTRRTSIHVRGNFLDPGEAVERGVPVALGSIPDGAPPSRLGVAQWITQPGNPLTARVMVNRVWARLFGTGIVETEEDFGTQGLRPTHPDLLDWLSIEYRQQGWSLKRLLKTIVMSSTYQQTSSVSGERLAADPRNRLFSRGPRFRMSAEMIRDSALAASGLLTRKLGGPSVMPPQPSGVWKTTYSNRAWIDAKGEDRYRRGLYTYWKRTSPYPSMTTFDAGSGEFCLVRRVRTNTPLQALITLNDPAFVEAAGGLALRLRKHGLDFGFRCVLTRPPNDRERERLLALHKRSRLELEKDLAAAANLVQSAGLDRITADAELAAWVAVANVLLNLDESITKP